MGKENEAHPAYEDLQLPTSKEPEYMDLKENTKADDVPKHIYESKITVEPRGRVAAAAVLESRDGKSGEAHDSDGEYETLECL